MKTEAYLKHGTLVTNHLAPHILQSRVEVKVKNGQLLGCVMNDKTRVLPAKRDEYRYFTNIQTRWSHPHVPRHVQHSLACRR